METHGKEYYQQHHTSKNKIKESTTTISVEASSNTKIIQVFFIVPLRKAAVMGGFITDNTCICAWNLVFFLQKRPFTGASQSTDHNGCVTMHLSSQLTNDTNLMQLM
jgi:hypothetical protein